VYALLGLVATPAALKDTRKAAAIEDHLARLRRAQDWVDAHQTDRARKRAKDTALPYDVALASARPHALDTDRRRPAVHHVRAADRRHVHRPEADPGEGRLLAVRGHAVQREPAGLDDAGAVSRDTDDAGPARRRRPRPCSFPRPRPV